MSTATAERSTTADDSSPEIRGTSGAGASAWVRRAPLLPALIFTIVMTQLPFLGTVIISFMDWNAYYPDERGFTGFDNFARVFTDTNARRPCGSRSCSPCWWW